MHGMHLTCAFASTRFQAMCLSLGCLVHTQFSILRRYATSWGDADITCVSPAWVDASAAAGVAVPPHDFPPPVPHAARCVYPAPLACCSG